MANKRFLQVILPLKLDWEPWYYTTVSSTDGDVQSIREIAVGDRVSVRFGPRTYVAVVSNVSEKAGMPEEKIIPIGKTGPGLPPVSLEEISLWRFMADYYMCSVGEVYRQAYPSGRTDREEAAQRARLRHEESVRKEIARLEHRLESLQTRLEKKESDLQGKHSAKVRAGLTAGRDKIIMEMAALRQRMDSLSGGEDPKDNLQLGFRWENDCPALMGKITDAFARGKTVLLECTDRIRPSIYTDLIKDALDECSQSLLLVPEIQKSQKLEMMLEKDFGSKLVVFNSSKSVSVRRDICDRLRSGEPTVVLGTRSSIYLPFRKLGLVLVDDEHDSSYKQDATPRYNARDMASVLASIHGARLLLSSSFPSLESVFNSMAGRYLRIDSGIEDTRLMPEVQIIDTHSEMRKNGMAGCLSRKLIAEMARTMDMGGRVMLLRVWGRTDFVENDVKLAFPGKSVGGPDCVDADIMIGTMSAARHMDLVGVGLLCIIQPDKMVGRQNFRADEYSLQALEIFRSRLGSSSVDETALFVIQSTQADHPVYQALLSGSDLCSKLLEERREFDYPPYSRLVDILLRGRSAEQLEAQAMALGSRISSALPGLVLEGPMPPEYEKAQGGQQRRLRVVLPKDRGLTAKKDALRRLAFQFAKENACDLHIDVDPL